MSLSETAKLRNDDDTDDDCLELAFLENIDDEDGVPPGCEEILYDLKPKLLLSGLESNKKYALIGLEYVVEVSSEIGVDCMSPSFYMCLLCDKQFNVKENILEHLEQPNHRLLYLDKFFPRAFSLFHSVGTCVEKWPIEMLFTLETVIDRIESVKGRLPIHSLCKNKWDVKSHVVRRTIDHGVHLRETEDLVYDDIISPGSNEKEVFRDKNVKCLKMLNSDIHVETQLETQSKKYTEITLSDTENESMDENTTPSLKSKVKTTRKEKKSQPMSSSQSSIEEGEIIVENEIFGYSQSSGKTPFIPTYSKTTQSKPTRYASRSLFRVRSPLRSNSRSQTRYRSDTYSRSQSEHRSPSSYRFHSMCRSRSRSRSSSRSRSRSPSRSHFRSRSRSKSRFEFRSRSKSPVLPHSSIHQRKRAKRPDDFSDWEWELGWTEPVVNDRSKTSSKERSKSMHRKKSKNKKNPRSPPSSTRKTKTTKEDKKLWATLEHELTCMRKSLHRKRKLFIQRPEEHPQYEAEWKSFWSHHRNHSKVKDKNDWENSSSLSWSQFWSKRIKKIDKQKIKAKKKELERQYELLRSKPLFISRSPEATQTTVIPDYLENLTESEEEMMKQIYSWEEKPENSYINSCFDSDPFEEFRDYGKASSILQLLNFKLPIDQDVLHLLRMLAALEDCLGAFVPIITCLLSSAVSAERLKTGSSPKFLRQDSCCITLWNALKTRLELSLRGGLLIGAKATAVTQAIEQITRLLAEPSNQQNAANSMTVSPLSNTAPPKSDMAESNSDLQSVGCLPSPPSTNANTLVPSSSITDVENVCQSADNCQMTTLPFQERKIDVDHLNFDPKLQITAKNLVLSFQTLNETQQCNLIDCLRRLEQEKKQQYRQSASSMSDSTPPSSPLSIGQPRLPAIQKLTGLSLDELKCCGLPLDQIDIPIDVSHRQENQLNNNHVQSQSQPLQVPLEQQTDRTSVQNCPEYSALNQPKDDNRMHLDESNPFQHWSYCIVSLDPRQTRLYFEEHSTNSRNALPTNKLISLEEFHVPRLIPLSPITSRKSSDFKSDSPQYFPPDRDVPSYR